MTEREVMRERLILYSLGAIVGVFSGVTAILFRVLIVGFSSLFIIIPQAIGVLGWVIIPVVGAIIVGFVTVRYAPEAKGHGVPEVLAAYAFEGGKIRMRVPILKGIVSAVCIGSGGSCGREGPIAQIGAGVGSTLASKMNLGNAQTRTLLMCGLSSGIAATFNAPLGGALFGIEVLTGGIVGFSILPVILASVVATAVASFILDSGVLAFIIGSSTSHSFNAPVLVMNHPIELIFYLILGVGLGVVSVIWMRGFYFIEDLFEKIKASPYIKPSIGGLITGILALIVLALQDVFGYNEVLSPGDLGFPAVMGVGYPFIDTALVAQAGFGALLVFAVLKLLATSSTLGSGGSGGVFAPTLFIGAGFGGAFGLAFSWAGLDTRAFALVGMAALFAGAGRAPMTCIVMLMEMTGDYSMILPLMIAVSASYLVSSLIENESIYTLKLYRRGLRVKKGLHVGVLKSIHVSDIMTLEPTTLSPDMTPEEVCKVIDKTNHTKFPVVDENNRILGIMIAEELFQKPEGEDKEYRVRDLMKRDFLHLAPTCTMDSALRAMMARDEGHAVIVDPKNPEHMLGYITKADVLRAYEIAIIRLQKQGVDVEDIGPPDAVEYFSKDR
ncbi:MAG: chloride channel protein [Candidatus Thorarchaeota archaeon]|nr:MAG: hypothetical protein DRP09_03055 [Candidatus Thorarchaeota archaeon]RLI59832.1 MAG: hypothetical protein DRO87_01745 [Candidatus Thorarchaeota archaeon]